MNTKAQTVAEDSTGKIEFFEKWLSVWVALCIVAGITLGNTLPETFKFLASIEYASVNLVVAILIWGMVYPMTTLAACATSAISQKDFSSPLLLTGLLSHLRWSLWASYFLKFYL
ncbi:MAG: arsenic resistance protein [Rhodospirillales bacterium]